MQSVRNQIRSDTSMYKGSMYEYTKKQMFRNTTVTKKHLVNHRQSDEDKIFKDSTKPGCWEIPSKYFTINNDPVKLFLMNNNIKGYIVKEQWKQRDSIICNSKQHLCL